MKAFAAVLAAVALLPLAAVAGYLVNPDPAFPSTRAAAAHNLKPIPSLRETKYLFNPTAGVYKNQAADALSQIAYPDKYLHKMGVVKWEWLKQTCDYYTSSGKTSKPYDHDIVVVCVNERVTKAEVLRYAKSLFSPKPKA